VHTRQAKQLIKSSHCWVAHNGKNRKRNNAKTRLA
jgi:hypothetical protein